MRKVAPVPLMFCIWSVTQPIGIQEWFPVKSTRLLKGMGVSNCGMSVGVQKRIDHGSNLETPSRLPLPMLCIATSLSLSLVCQWRAKSGLPCFLPSLRKGTFRYLEVIHRKREERGGQHLTALKTGNIYFLALY
jgi:hypothetical protein